MINTATFQNNKKKIDFHMKPDQFLHIVKFSKMDLGILPYLRRSSLQQLVTVGLTPNGQYLHLTAVTRLFLLANLKLHENGEIQVQFLVF